ncbi:hypothetical protein LTR17_003314 [Elasticomyces elasticus]|nr:hypothetical protein LTR17_003314 [Elasticomyces elasticus]
MPKVGGDDDESDPAFIAEPGHENARVMTARLTGTPRKPSHKSKNEDTHSERGIWARYSTGKWDNCLRSKYEIERVQDAFKVIYPESAVPSIDALRARRRRIRIALVEATQAWGDFKNESIPSRRGRVTIDWSACREVGTSNLEPSSDSSSDDNGDSDSEEAKSEDEAPEPARKKQKLCSMNVKLGNHAAG